MRLEQPQTLTDQQCVPALLAAGSDDPGTDDDCLGLLPAIRTSHNQAIEQQRWWEDHDVRIDVPLPQFSRREGTTAVLTNPSVLCRRGRLLLAARAMLSVEVQPLTARTSSH